MDKEEITMPETTTETQAIPLPTDLDEFEGDLETAEEGYVPQFLLPTLPDAQRSLARVRYFRQQAREIDSVFASEIAVLEAELQRVKQRRQEAAAPWQRREGWYMFALEQFAHTQLASDSKLKTIKLPAGDLVMRAQQPEWKYDDDQVIALLKDTSFSHLLRTKTEIEKTLLKNEARVVDGVVQVIDSETGEAVDLPIAVTERPPSFSLKIEI